MKKTIIILVSFFVIFLMISNTTAVSNTLTLERKDISEKVDEKNNNLEEIEEKLSIFKNNLDLKQTTGIFEFIAAWIITWAILVVDFFETFHPIAYKIMEQLQRPMIVLFFPMTYVLFVVAFFKVLLE
jgi:hypothetical protein